LAGEFTQEWYDARERARKAPHGPASPARATIAAPAAIQALQKYGAVKTTVNGLLFDSKKEARRYQELLLWQQVGAIRDLELQPRYELIASNGEIVGHFTPDFRYWSLERGKLVVEDVKGGSATKTTAYRLRKRLAQACHGITIEEV
jgi:hypothetical protein